VNDGTTTSSPGPTPSARSASVIASVPLATPTACGRRTTVGELALEGRRPRTEDEAPSSSTRSIAARSSSRSGSSGVLVSNRGTGMGADRLARS
jgi:hypothetical protein